MEKFDSTKYKNDYIREHYARLSVLVDKNDREKIDSHWKSCGYKSFNAYINDLIRKDMHETNNKGISVGDINQSGDGNNININ